MVGVAGPQKIEPPRRLAPNGRRAPVEDAAARPFAGTGAGAPRPARLPPRAPRGPAQVEPLAEVVRSSLTGLALWWLDHPDVPRAVLVDVMLRVTAGVLATAR